jgi:hypothetical protein
MQAAPCALRKYHTNSDRTRTKQDRDGEIEVWRGDYYELAREKRIP